MGKPIPVNAFTELFKKTGNQAQELYKQSGGKLKTACSIEIDSTYNVDSQGNLVLGGDIQSVIPSSVPAKAEANILWKRARTKAKDGAIRIVWRLDWNDETNG